MTVYLGQMLTMLAEKYGKSQYLENTRSGKVVTYRKRKGNGEESLADHVLLQLLGTAKYQEQPHGGAI